MEKENEINEYITPSELTKQLEEHSGIIVSAVDSILKKRLGGAEARLEKKIDNVRDEYILSEVN
jgi:hypothetical protein